LPESNRQITLDAPARVNATSDHIKATRDRMNLGWRTVKATGDHFNPTRDHLNLISRTVESDRRWD
jgi:hypothetical protein